jgi:YHS domain-containing protein
MPPVVTPGAVITQTPAPQGSPPLAMDGYCTVELAQRERWVKGDVRYGAVHRGQTYLFSGPEQQKQFLANPDQFGLAMSGYDPVLALEKRQYVPGIRKHGLYFNNRIYLFSSETTLTQFWNAASRYADGVRLAEAGGPIVR